MAKGDSKKHRKAERSHKQDPVLSSTSTADATISKPATSLNTIKSKKKEIPNAPVDVEASTQGLVDTGRPKTKQKTSMTVIVNSKSAAREYFQHSDQPSKTKRAGGKPKKESAPSEHELSPEPGEEGSEVSDRDREDSDEKDVHLHGFSSDNDDSSDDENATGAKFDVSKLPTVAKDDGAVKRKLEKAKAQTTEERGVIYLGRIPHGFYEDQLRAYFSQFGTVTRLRLSRNKKTGKSKHYAFIEFDSLPVAKIVAETMDNYLLMGHILRCKIMNKDELHPELWVSSNRKWRTVPHDRVLRVQHNKERTEEEHTRAVNRLIKRQHGRKRKLAQAGIKYDFEGIAYINPKRVKT